MKVSFPLVVSSLLQLFTSTAQGEPMRLLQDEQFGHPYIHQHGHHPVNHSEGNQRHSKRDSKRGSKRSSKRYHPWNAEHLHKAYGKHSKRLGSKHQDEYDLEKPHNQEQQGKEHDSSAESKTTSIHDIPSRSIPSMSAFSTNPSSTKGEIATLQSTKGESMGNIEIDALRIQKSEALETRIEKETRQNHLHSIETNAIEAHAEKHGSH